MTLRVFAPGRVNTMGDHIDYLGGLAQPLALPQGTTVELSPIEGGQHKLSAAPMARPVGRSEHRRPPQDNGLIIWPGPWRLWIARSA